MRRAQPGGGVPPLGGSEFVGEVAGAAADGVGALVTSGNRGERDAGMTWGRLCR